MSACSEQLVTLEQPSTLSVLSCRHARCVTLQFAVSHTDTECMGDAVAPRDPPKRGYLCENAMERPYGSLGTSLSHFRTDIQCILREKRCSGARSAGRRSMHRVQAEGNGRRVGRMRPGWPLRGSLSHRGKTSVSRERALVCSSDCHSHSEREADSACDTYLYCWCRQSSVQAALFVVHSSAREKLGRRVPGRTLKNV
jgi:hypothetical protein